jgi:hypothetical protein
MRRHPLRIVHPRPLRSTAPRPVDAAAPAWEEGAERGREPRALARIGGGWSPRCAAVDSRPGRADQADWRPGPGAA